MEKPRIYILIVVYNKRCEDLVPFFDVFAGRQNTVIVYDNSVEDLDNCAFCEKNHIVYLGGTGNLGLSAAYNAAVDYCRTLGDSGFLCIFDDDTEVKADYLDILREAIASGERAVFVPLLTCGGKVISPAILKGNFHCSFFKSKKAAVAYDGPRLTALNSGMAIDLRIFDDYRYDERLFLDGIDHKFIADMALKGIPIRVMNYELKHHLSAYEKPSFDSALHRYRIYKNDVMVFAKDRASKILLRHTLKLTLQYRTLAFFKEYKTWEK